LEHLLFNSVPATHALTVRDESLGKSTGQAFQIFELKHRPLYRQPPGSAGGAPYGHLVIQARESAGGNWQTWERKEDLPAEAGAFYRLDPVTGTIMFGDGVHGRIPPDGGEVRAAAYRYVAGGARGNVKAGAITVLYSAELKQTRVVEVRNLVDARDGDDEESVEEAKRRAPEMLRIRNRAVTVEDYEYLAHEVSPRVAKVRALGPDSAANGLGNLDRSPGEVNIIIIPDSPEDERPMPSPELRLETARYLDERRLLTSHLTVTGPCYLPIDVAVSVKVWRNLDQPGGVSTQELQDRIVAAIKAFLHPLTGGRPEGQGWQVGQHVLAADLLQVIQEQVDPSLGFIESLELKAGADRPVLLSQSTSSKVWVQLADYEIACSGQHRVDIAVVGK
jgi:predicted phage baseplate assembly protein